MYQISFDSCSQMKIIISSRKLFTFVTDLSSWSFWPYSTFISLDPRLSFDTNWTLRSLYTFHSICTCKYEKMFILWTVRLPKKRKIKMTDQTSVQQIYAVYKKISIYMFQCSICFNICSVYLSNPLAPSFLWFPCFLLVNPEMILPASCPSHLSLPFFLPRRQHQRTVDN